MHQYIAAWRMNGDLYAQYAEGGSIHIDLLEPTHPDYEAACLLAGETTLNTLKDTP
jgi:hypothetical protein